VDVGRVLRSLVRQDRQRKEDRDHAHEAILFRAQREILKNGFGKHRFGSWTTRATACFWQGRRTPGFQDIDRQRR